MNFLNICNKSPPQYPGTDPKDLATQNLVDTSRTWRYAIKFQPVYCSSAGPGVPAHSSLGSSGLRLGSNVMLVFLVASCFLHLQAPIQPFFPLQFACGGCPIAFPNSFLCALYPCPVSLLAPTALELGLATVSTQCMAIDLETIATAEKRRISIPPQDRA